MVNQQNYLQSSQTSVHFGFLLVLLDLLDGDQGLLELILSELRLSLSELVLLVGNHEFFRKFCDLLASLPLSHLAFQRLI